MAGMEFAGHVDFLAYEVRAFRESVRLPAARQHKRVTQARNIQFREILSSLRQSPLSRNHDLSRRETRILDRLGNLHGVERFSRFRKDLTFAFY